MDSANAEHHTWDILAADLGCGIALQLENATAALSGENEAKPISVRLCTESGYHIYLCFNMHSCQLCVSYVLHRYSI